MSSIKRTVEKIFEINQGMLDYWIMKEEKFDPGKEHPLNIEMYKVRIECYQAFLQDLNKILDKINTLKEKKGKK